MLKRLNRANEKIQDVKIENKEVLRIADNLHNKLNTATEKIHDVEIKDKELCSNANNLQSTILNMKNELKMDLSINGQCMSEIAKKHQREIKESCEKFSLPRKEIQESSKGRENIMRENEKYIHFINKMEHELQNSKLQNDQPSSDTETWNDELNACKYQLKENVLSYQNVGIQTELLKIQSDFYPSTGTETLTPVSKNLPSRNKGDLFQRHTEKQKDNDRKGIQVKKSSLKLSKAKRVKDKIRFSIVAFVKVNLLGLTI